MTIHFIFLHWTFFSLKQWVHILWFRGVLPRLPVSRRFVTSPGSADIRLSGTLKSYSADHCLPETNVISLAGPHPPTGNAHVIQTHPTRPNCRPLRSFISAWTLTLGQLRLKLEMLHRSTSPFDQSCFFPSPPHPSLPHVVIQRASPQSTFSTTKMSVSEGAWPPPTKKHLFQFYVSAQNEESISGKKWENFEKKKTTKCTSILAQTPFQ